MRWLIAPWKTVKTLKIFQCFSAKWTFNTISKVWKIALQRFWIACKKMMAHFQILNRWSKPSKRFNSFTLTLQKWIRFQLWMKFSNTILTKFAKTTNSTSSTLLGKCANISSIFLTKSLNYLFHIFNKENITLKICLVS